MRSVYVHIPFCKNICTYCDFCKFYYNSEWVSTYLCALENEIDSYYDKDEVKSIYIGGGTPSSLKENELEKLFDIVDIFKRSKNCEVTFEMNVNDITKELLAILKKYKVNRLSIGIQSFNKYKIEFLNRKHTKKEIYEKFKLLNNYNFDNINIDLIYGVHFEDMKILSKDLKEALKLEPHHISIYSLIIEKNTVLYNKNLKSIDEDLESKMYKYICNKLKKTNYVHYEVSNYSLPGYASIHNKTYWDNEEYYGFGLSSHGFIGNVRYENTKNLKKYINKEYRKEEIFLSKETDMENYIMLGLRKLEGISKSKFFNLYKIDIKKEFNFDEMIIDGFVIEDEDTLKIPESKIYIMNEILNNIFNKQ